MQFRTLKLRDSSGNGAKAKLRTDSTPSPREVSMNEPLPSLEARNRMNPTKASTTLAAKAFGDQGGKLEVVCTLRRYQIFKDPFDRTQLSASSACRSERSPQRRTRHDMGVTQHHSLRAGVLRQDVGLVRDVGVLSACLFRLDQHSCYLGIDVFRGTQTSLTLSLAWSGLAASTTYPRRWST